MEQNSKMEQNQNMYGANFINREKLLIGANSKMEENSKMEQNQNMHGANFINREKIIGANSKNGANSNNGAKS